LNFSVFQLNFSVFQLNFSVFEAPLDLRIARAEHIGTQGTENTSQRSLWITQKWGQQGVAKDCEKAFVKEQKPRPRDWIRQATRKPKARSANRHRNGKSQEPRARAVG
jgi:hypothetical protein